MKLNNALLVSHRLAANSNCFIFCILVLFLWSYWLNFGEYAFGPTAHELVTVCWIDCHVFVYCWDNFHLCKRKKIVRLQALCVAQGHINLVGLIWNLQLYSGALVSQITGAPCTVSMACLHQWVTHDFDVNTWCNTKLFQFDTDNFCINFTDFDIDTHNFLN